MPGRSTRRRHQKQLHRLSALPPPDRDTEATRHLLLWRQEACHRAASLGAPAVWDLANDPHTRAKALALEPNGELLADLERVCAEAVASAMGSGVRQRPWPKPSTSIGHAESVDEKPMVVRDRDKPTEA